MSLKETKKVDTNRYQLEITVDGEKFREAIKEAYKKNGKKINVPGFRKGKAPLHIIETYYGSEVFFEDAFNLLYNDLVDEAITESGLKVINDKMDFDLVSISKENGVDFKVSVTTYPEIEVGEYKGLKAEKAAVKVDAAEVNAEVNAMAERNARMVSVEDRAAADGDTVIIDFEGFADQDARRIAKANGSPYPYWTRTRSAQGDTTWVVSAAGGTAPTSQTTQLGVRPILILPQGLSVDDEGNIQPNAAPTLTSPSGASGANIGIRSAPFLYEYTPTDPEGLSLSLTEKLDQAVTRTLTAASGSTQRFEAVYDALAFLKLANGAHTLQVTASDGMASAAFQATFTKAVRAASLTLTQPIAAGKPITAATLQVEGSIPDDAAFSVQVTNNALDDQPVWQDATEAVRQGGNVLFTHSTAAKGPAFNFRIEAARGASGDGGYISKVSGAFQ